MKTFLLKLISKYAFSDVSQHITDSVMVSMVDA